MKNRLLAILALCVAGGTYAKSVKPIYYDGGYQQPRPERPRPPPRPHPHPPIHHYPHYYPSYPSQVEMEQNREPIAINSLRVGDRLPGDYRFNDYVVNDYQGHGLSRPSSNQRWALIAGSYYLYDTKSYNIVDIVRQ